MLARASRWQLAQDFPSGPAARRPSVSPSRTPRGPGGAGAPARRRGALTGKGGTSGDGDPGGLGVRGAVVVGPAEGQLSRGRGDGEEGEEGVGGDGRGEVGPEHLLAVVRAD